MTDSMQNAINETNRRRKIQQEYNEKHGIVPAKVFSAEALSDEQLARLKAALERTSGKHVTLDVHVDAALVGGMRVEMAGKSYDNTLESRMDHLRRVLAARS